MPHKKDFTSAPRLGTLFPMDEEDPTDVEKERRVGWRHWYHITLGTYGHWLRGDPRRWSERHHRKHVPHKMNQSPDFPDFAAGLLKYSKKIMKRPVFRFQQVDFPAIGKEFLFSAKLQKMPLLCLAVTAEHCHLLARCEDDDPRLHAGHLKAHVYHKLFRGQATPWSKRSNERPIRDYDHGKEAFQYILDHRKEGAWVWSYRDGATM